jgi:hypothetical protein
MLSGPRTHEQLHPPRSPQIATAAPQPADCHCSQAHHRALSPRTPGTCALPPPPKPPRLPLQPGAPSNCQSKDTKNICTPPKLPLRPGGPSNCLQAVCTGLADAGALQKHVRTRWNQDCCLPLPSSLAVLLLRACAAWCSRAPALSCGLLSSASDSMPPELSRTSTWPSSL